MVTIIGNERKDFQKSIVQEGFTLIELLIGITIIGLLTAAALYIVPTLWNRAYKSKTETTLQVLKQSIMLYKNDKDEYPKSLKDLITAGVLREKTVPKDGWDRPFVYRVTPEGKHAYELYSYGPDGKSGSKASRISAWKD